MSSNDVVFGGFTGGHDSVPGVGDVPPSTGGFEQINTFTNPQLYAHTHFDPNNCPGIVHWDLEEFVASALSPHPPVDK
ncbi:unnamed protein product [Adineta ricciae]|uniref:Uncharacterized protein n=1 Tax=Adineta ricciae TaxID=249248 RepID=A0A816BJ34_ADIRI|nr:unnamed protein product [Adineta ricciae]CAF1608318.1 unnamed protein product [Adineta ricciae]